MNYRVVTITSGKAPAWYHMQDLFYASLRGHDVMTIQPERWGGLMTKPRTLYAAIEKGMIKEDYLIFADSWDLVWAAHPEEVIETYLAFNTDVVISAEKNCFPADLKEEYDKLADKTTPYNYLNSGFIVGETEAIFECLKEMNLPSIPDDHYDNENNRMVHPNDQEEWQKIFLKQPVRMALDQHQILSQTLHDAEIEDFDLSKDRIRNKVTGAYPCSFHFNGNGTDRMQVREPFLKKLNLL